MDVPYLHETIKTSKLKIHDLKKEIKEDPVYKTWLRVFGSKANLGSRDQLGDVIFGELGYKHAGYTLTQRGKTVRKRYVADEEAFEEINIPFTQKYFRIEKIQNALDTWLLGIASELTTAGRVHPFYHQNRVRSHRSSSSGPNFQNNPVRNPEMAEMIRRCFIPDEGDEFAEVDYAQQEVRAGVCHHHDANMIRYVKDTSTDMHYDQAQELFMLPRHQIGKKTTRDMSKNMFVFPQFYGSSYVNCAKDIWRALILRKPVVEGTDKLVKDHLREKGIKELGLCDPKIAPAPGTLEHHFKRVQDKLWDRTFPGYRDWKRKYFREYQQRGWIRLPTGFVIAGVMGFTEVTNYSIQGSAYHCLLWSLIRLMKNLIKYKMKTKLIGEIHDSHQSTVPPKELNAWADMCHQVMVVDLAKEWKWLNPVPLDIEVEVADVGLPWSAKRQWIRGETGWFPKK